MQGRSAWTIDFRYAGLWPLISKRRTRPAATAIGSEARDAWDVDDNKAMFMIISSVRNDLTLAIVSCETAPAAWDYLTSRFDRDRDNLSIVLFRDLILLRYKDDDDLRLHLDRFHQRWTRIASRCATSSQTVAVAMRTMLENDDVKGSFLLSTLRGTMSTVIDDMSIRNITAFRDIQAEIRDISENHFAGEDAARRRAARQRRLAPNNNSNR